MPHAIIEYSDNIRNVAQSADLSRVVHDAMMQSGLFSAADIKTRSYAAQDFLVGEKGRNGSFIHLTVYLLEGRTTAQKQGLSDALLAALKSHAPMVHQLSIDIRELKKDIYRKHAAA